ncbi:MAG: vitamin B12 dependent methionine synthase, partial [Candidatus Aminicenantes bacterium]|nr:vitamin B12 dependent methionine synthase [Candidatus Aminicenantes bacterium]
LFHPRAFYREAFVEERMDDTVTIDGCRFKSKILRQNLEKAFKVFFYLITVGPELENHAAALGDPLRRYCMECLADAALEAAAETLRARLLRESGFEMLSSMSPGSLENWPITEQVPLFGLLGEGPAATGVRLTDSLMMLPRKSISGLFFPSEESFVSCRLCSRAKCPGRKAVFKGSSG